MIFSLDLLFLTVIHASQTNSLSPFKPLQLTGNISGLRIGLLKEGFHMPDADMKIMTTVKEAADRLSSLGATVGQVSVPMHFDGRLKPLICKTSNINSIPKTT